MHPAWLALLLLLPGAHACSLAGPTPGPGLFMAWTPGGYEADILAEVEGRGLGAGCELENPFAVEGDRFAYLENAYDYDKLVLAEGGVERSVALDMDGRPRSLAITPDHVIVASDQEMALVAWDDLQVTPLPSPLSDTNWDGRLFGPVAAWAGTWNGKPEVAAYDLAAMEWLLEPTDPEDVGLPDGYLVAANEDWIVIEDDGISALRFENGVVAQVEDADAWMYGLEGDVLYGVDQELHKWDLFSGGRHSQEGPPVQFTGVVDGGRLILETYSVTWIDKEAREDLGDPDLPKPKKTPMPAAMSLVAVCLAFALRRTYP